jgi:predicted nucleic acid-binding protein
MPFTEAMHLLAFSRAGQQALLEMVERRAVQILSIGEADVPHVKSLMQEYADLPMDFADATLVRVAIRERLKDIFTLDDDFNVYRLGGRRRFSIVPI